MNLTVLKKYVRHAASVSWSPLYRIAGRFLRYSPGAFRILSLHHIPRAHVQLFERLLEHLVDTHGLITPEEAERRLTGNAPVATKAKVPYLLTFDDGFVSHLRVVAPVLENYGAKGIFFICPELMSFKEPAEQRHLLQRYLLKTHDDIDSLLMSWEDVNLLRTKGHTIGSHGMTHQKISSLDVTQQILEIDSSAQAIDKALGKPPKWFAFPFGDIRSMDVTSLRSVMLRYRFCCNTLRGINERNTSPFTLYRETIDLRTPWDYQTMVLAGGLDLLYRSEIKQLENFVFES